MQDTQFEAIYTRYHRVVYAYLMSLCRDESLAAELTQETFFKALKAIDRFDGKCPVNIWLCRIAKRRAGGYRPEIRPHNTGGHTARAA